MNKAKRAKKTLVCRNCKKARAISCFPEKMIEQNVLWCDDCLHAAEGSEVVGRQYRRDYQSQYHKRYRRDARLKKCIQGWDIIGQICRRGLRISDLRSVIVQSWVMGSLSGSSARMAMKKRDTAVLNESSGACQRCGNRSETLVVRPAWPHGLYPEFIFCWEAHLAVCSGCCVAGNLYIEMEARLEALGRPIISSDGLRASLNTLGAVLFGGLYAPTQE